MTAAVPRAELEAELARLHQRIADLEGELARDTSPDRALAESERRHASLVAAMAEGVVLQGHDGSILTCNPAAEEILGLSVDQMMGRTSMDPRWRAVREDGSPYPGDEHPAMVTLRTGEPIRNAVMGVHKPDGSLTWISINTQPLEHATPERRAVVSSFTDITHLKEVLEALARSKETLRLALDAACMGVWSWHIPTDVVEWSGRVEEIFGLEAGTFDRTFETYRSQVHPEDEVEVLEKIRRTVEEPGNESYEVVHRIVRDGNVRWVHGVGRLFRDEHGAPLIMRGTVADITRQKELETQLLQSQRLEAVGRIAGGVAHDFNNLLTVIFASLADATETLGSTTPARDALASVDGAARRAASLVSQLLTFARKQSRDLRVVSVDALVGNVEALLSRVLGEDIDLVTRCRSDPWTVRADPNQLEQVLMNLGINARNAMPQGGCLEIVADHLEIDSSEKPGAMGLAPGTYVRICVRDDGVGMTEEVRGRIFDPFFTTREGGSGLGLATSYAIVEGLGGTITCGSEPGRGSEFTIIIPGQREQPGPGEAEPPPLPQGAGWILVVEDDDAVRRVAVRALSRAGYRVDEAADGREALAHAQLGQLDLVLTDVVMPGMSGPELAERIRVLHPNLRVLFASGYPGSALEAHGAEFKRARIIAKPYTGSTLAAAVHAALRRDRGSANRGSDDRGSDDRDSESPNPDS